MSYNGIIGIAHEKFQKLLLPFDYRVVWLALSKALQSLTSKWLVLITSQQCHNDIVFIQLEYFHATIILLCMQVSEVLAMRHVKVDKSSSTLGTRLAVTVTTTGHTHFHSRPHSNATSFLQNNKGVGFPGSVGPTITG